MRSDTVRITFVGDLMCQMQQIWAVKKAACGYDVVFDRVKYLWKDSDYVVGNLETPVAGPGFRLTFEEMRFNAPMDFLWAIKRAGIDFISTANNHILDRGADGLNATLSQIALVGLDTTGAYATRGESEQIFVKKIGGIRVAFVGGTYDTNAARRADMLKESDLWKIDYLHHPTPFLGTWLFAIKSTLKSMVPYSLRRRIKLWLNGGREVWCNPQLDCFPEEDFEKSETAVFLTAVCEKIRRAQSLADVVIAIPHIGGQYNTEPGPWQLKVTDALIEAGANVVIANHAHAPLKIEMRRGSFVAHGLGNFCFTPRVGYYNDRCQADYSIVLSCEFDGGNGNFIGWKYSIVKTVTEANGVSVVMPPSDGDLADLDIISARVGAPAGTQMDCEVIDK